MNRSNSGLDAFERGISQVKKQVGVVANTVKAQVTGSNSPSQVPGEINNLEKNIPAKPQSQTTNQNQQAGGLSAEEIQKEENDRQAKLANVRQELEQKTQEQHTTTYYKPLIQKVEQIAEERRQNAQQQSQPNQQKGQLGELEQMQKEEKKAAILNPGITKQGSAELPRTKG